MESTAWYPVYPVPASCSLPRGCGALVGHRFDAQADVEPSVGNSTTPSRSTAQRNAAGPPKRGALKVRDAAVRGGLDEGPGFPLLKIDLKDVLACGTALLRKLLIFDDPSTGCRPSTAWRVPSGAPEPLTVRPGPGAVGEAIEPAY